MMMKTMAAGIMAMAIAGPVAAQDQPVRPRAELAVGVLQHAFNRFRTLPDNVINPESGSADVQVMWRSRRFDWALKPRLTAKVQVNGAGRTSFASVGAEWRQHVLNDRVYGQIGIGLAVHNGYLNTPDPFAPGLSNAERWRRYEIYSTHSSFGSPVLFNPNLSIGVRLNRRWAVEAVLEHYSHRRLFADTNDGIEMAGFRLVRGM